MAEKSQQKIYMDYAPVETNDGKHFTYIDKKKIVALEVLAKLEHKDVCDIIADLEQALSE